MFNFAFFLFQLCIIMTSPYNTESYCCHCIARFFLFWWKFFLCRWFRMSRLQIRLSSFSRFYFFPTVWLVHDLKYCCLLISFIYFIIYFIVICYCFCFTWLLVSLVLSGQVRISNTYIKGLNSEWCRVTGVFATSFLALLKPLLECPLSTFIPIFKLVS